MDSIRPGETLRLLAQRDDVPGMLEEPGKIVLYPFLVFIFGERSVGALYGFILPFKPQQPERSPAVLHELVQFFQGARS